jgi:hypothetical protein
MTAHDFELRHGYTLGDLEMMVRAAVVADRLLVGDIEYRRDIARSAICVALYEAERPPDRADLIRVGWQAIAHDVRWGYRHRGYPDSAWQDYEPVHRPRFAQYWVDYRVVPSHEARIVEGVAAWQVVDALTPTYREAILALAAHDNYRTAAQGLGLKDKAFRFRISTARKQILARWFEGETPRRTRQVDRRVGAYDREPATHCGNGHEYTPENTRIRHRILRGRRHTSRVCRACESSKGAAA